MTGGEQQDFAETSPDGGYRVVFFTPSRLQRLLHRGMNDPGFTRVYRARDGRLLRTGPVVDFFGGDGDIVWLNEQTGEIAVGMNTHFYHLPPLDRRGRPLPVAHEASPPPGG